MDAIVNKFSIKSVRKIPAWVFYHGEVREIYKGDYKLQEITNFIFKSLRQAAEKRLE